MVRLLGCLCWVSWCSPACPRWPQDLSAPLILVICLNTFLFFSFYSYFSLILVSTFFKNYNICFNAFAHQFHLPYYFYYPLSLPVTVHVFLFWTWLGSCWRGLNLLENAESCSDTQFNTLLGQPSPRKPCYGGCREGSVLGSRSPAPPRAVPKSRCPVHEKAWQVGTQDVRDSRAKHGYVIYLRGPFYSSLENSMPCPAL